VEPFSTPTKKLPCPKTAIVLHQYAKALTSPPSGKRPLSVSSYALPSLVKTFLTCRRASFVSYRGVGKDLLDAKEILVEVIPLLSLSKLLYLLAEGFLLGILLGYLAGLCLLTAPDITQKAHWKTNES
jgi:hypothetical protein